MKFPHNQSNDGSSSGSRSNDDDKGKQPVVEPPASTPSSSSGETILLQPRWGSFQCFLDSLKAGGKVDPNATARRAGFLCKLLKFLGMSPEVEEDELCNMLKLSGYADEDGTLDCQRFKVFANDFKILESLHKYKASSLKGKLDRGPLGNFFGALEAGAVSGFSYRDFVDAFQGLKIKLTDEEGDSLVQYAELHSGVPISFEQFLKMLYKEHGKVEQRTGYTTLFRRTLALDRGQPLGRVMAFVSSYTRSAMRKGAAMTVP